MFQLILELYSHSDKFDKTQDTILALRCSAPSLWKKQFIYLILVDNDQTSFVSSITQVAHHLDIFLQYIFFQ